MTVLSAIKIFILTKTGASDPLTVDFLGTTLPGYSIVSLPGGGWVEKYINGGGKKEFMFALQATFSTADEEERLENNGFFETFSEWLDSQTKANVLPTLATGKTPESIEALGAGFLYEQGQSATGIYQIQCKLVYDQVP